MLMVYTRIEIPVSIIRRVWINIMSQWNKLLKDKVRI